jgi:PRTRC genetic system protein B
MSVFEYRQPTPVDYQLVQALLVYKRISADSNGARHLFASHEVHHEQSPPLIGAGHLLDAQAQQALLEALLSEHSGPEECFLPPTVIARNSVQLAWLLRPKVRPMWFRIRNAHFALEVPWPTLILCAMPGNLYIAALAKSRRPSAATPVFHAPLMNVHDNTLMCTGNAPLPHGWGLPEQAEYQRIVFKTAFSHVAWRRTLKIPKHKDVSTRRHLHFWRKLHKAKARQFPVSALVPLGMSVRQWLQMLLGRP